VRLLARRERFSGELAACLLAKGWPANDVEEALATLTQQGLLSDRRAIEAWLHHFRGARAVSQERLMVLLREKGADAATIEAAVAQWDDGIAAREALAAKFKGSPDPLRAARFLAGRGFDEDVISSVIESLEPA
jgi:SOS response regulatory protein OraA/RecX